MNRLRFLPFLLAFGAAGCAPLGVFSPLRPLEKKLVFQPAKFPLGNYENRSPEIEDAYFSAADGTELNGWFIDHPAPKAVALFFHGNAGNVSLCDESLKLLNRRHQLAVMTMDYRGYGRSSGTPSEQGILMDARAARTWLAKRKGVSEASIVLFGQSLGGAVAVDLAAKDGASGLVLASTFTSLPDAASDVFPWMLPKWNMTLKLASIDKIKNYHGPLLISHGDADTTISFEHGRRLFDAANEPKEFIRIANGKHNDPQSEEFRTALDRLLAKRELVASERR